MNERLPILVVLILCLALSGCDSRKAPTATPTPAPQSPGPSAPPAVVQSPREFSISAERSLADRLTALINKSPLWKAYFAHRLTQPGTAMPLIAVTANFTRKLDPPGGMERGGYQPGSVTLTLAIKNGADNAALYQSERKGTLPSVVFVKRGTPQEKAFSETEDVLLADGSDNAALTLMATHANAAREFLPLIEAMMMDAKARLNLRLFAVKAMSQIRPLPKDSITNISRLACVFSEVHMDTNRTVSNAAAEALAGIGAPAVEPLTALLADPNSVVRMQAIRVLGKMGPPAAPALAGAVTQKEWSVFVDVLKALEELGQDAAPAAPALLEELRGRDPLRRDAAARALARIGAPAVNGLVGALHSAKSDEAAAGAIINALGQVGPAAQAALPALEEIAKSRNRFLAGSAAEAIKRIKTVK